LTVDETHIAWLRFEIQIDHLSHLLFAIAVLSVAIVIVLVPVLVLAWRIKR
jgi:hypothetical protein